jgi:hypothetical protein
MGSFRLECDKDYGCDHRKGWSISENGHYFVELEKMLFVAIIKYFIKRIQAGL